MTDISEEDKLIWQQTVCDVCLIQNNHHIEDVPQKKKKIIQKETSLTYQNFNHHVELDTKADIDKQTLKRFKKEEFGVQATLDLHGLTLDAAFHAVRNFIISSYNLQKRVILIITGKGLPHKEQDVFAPKGSLKQSVPVWLQNDELAPIILTFIHPSEKLGGSGALYILLRRHRNTRLRPDKQS
ncbi:MAG: Smr/MutS family protein [Alphaproteobacteria bacterium]|nr:Smr/MutS family protein [Alphaproteobacteria bacterium]